MLGQSEVLTPMRSRIRTLFMTLTAAIPLAAMGLFAGLVLAAPLPEARLPQATLILDANGTVVVRLFTENRQVIPLAEMPQYLLDAVVAVEDRHFYRHHGLDPLGIARAVIRNLVAGEVVEGGSTLTQQLAKNLYLTSERTATRKLQEAIIAVKLERTYSKQEILGLYWNCIYLGSGTYGAEAASQTYFGKGARDLTLAEAALLAGLPRAPEYYSPLNNLEASIQRRNLVLEMMAQQGFVSQEQAAAAKQEPVRLVSPPSQDDGKAAAFHRPPRRLAIPRSWVMPDHQLPAELPPPLLWPHPQRFGNTGHRSSLRSAM